MRKVKLILKEVRGQTLYKKRITRLNLKTELGAYTSVLVFCRFVQAVRYPLWINLHEFQSVRLLFIVNTVTVKIVKRN